jgi:hypothetical protein
MLVYAMRVTGKMLLPEYDAWARERRPEKIPNPLSGDPRRHVGDAIYDFAEDPPRVRHGSVHGVHERERDLGGGYALLSEHFYYFGDKPVALPEDLQGMVQRTQGHRSISNARYLHPFVAWISGLQLRPNSLRGDPSEWLKRRPAYAQDVVPLGPRPRRRQVAGLRALTSDRPGRKRC